MKIPIWVIALAFVGYSAWAVNYWHCYKCNCCGKDPANTRAQTTGEPLFQWSTEQPEQDANFVKWKKALIKKGGQGDTLLITGQYRAGETYAGKAANLGSARAEALKAMMSPEVPADRVHVAYQLVEADALTASSGPKPSANFGFLKMILKKEEGAIIESDNAVTFLFPFNSTEKDSDPAVDAYLKKLVEKHKQTTATFSVIGHTDNVGEDARNQQLGLGRAKAIGQFLVNNGIDAKRINTGSKGESEPVADNNSEDGRHQNRRVVLTVNR
jgi:outer membrane protein OmpA-like peptidoglycan-associated protein